MSSRIRVAVDVRCLASEQLRGFARYTAELLNAMERSERLDLVLVSDRPMQMPSGTPDMSVHAPDRDSEWKREQVGLRALVKRLGADLLFSPANRGLPLFGIPSVLTLHDAVEWDRSLVERPAGRSLARFVYANVASLLGATRIITVSQHSADYLEASLGLGGDRVVVVSEAPGEAFVIPPDAVMRARVRRDLDLEFRYLLYVGGFDDKKSVDTLVLAWARLDPSRTPRLVLGGSVGAEAEYLLDLVTSVGGDRERLRFLGYVDDELLPALLAEAELFVFPALAEGFGLPPVEAMAVGTTTIVADAGALPEATRGAAPRFEPRDVSGLSALISRLVADPVERERLAGMGREAIIGRSWDAVARETAEVFADAATAGAIERIGNSARVVHQIPRWVR
ncbi:MAG: glycosyltransferase family 4 protein [Actinomycetia bacterium]|nr:glycosyltransferase family 4 protein [Actinomycetes bacterium]